MHKMKKLLYILFAMAFALCSCTEDIDLQDTTGKECIKLTIFNSPMTKADAGPDYERNLTHLDVFFYVEGQTDSPCVYYQRVTDSKYLTGAAEIPFYVVEEQINQIFPNGNTCDVLVIANLPDGIRPVLSDGVTKATFGTGNVGTEYNRLTALVLEKGNGYDHVGQNFIMAGFDGNVRKDGNNNASGTVKLVRAASKITITVNIPEQIVLNASEDSEEITMVPVLLDDQGNVPFKTALHNGVKYGYVYPAGMVDSDMSVITDEWYFGTDKLGYTKVKEIPADGATGVKKYQYTCEVPFYSYSSSWQKADEHAAHLTLEIPWKRVGENQYNTYYYQILVNAGGRRLDPNHWYDLYVNVGVIGSTVESKPVELDDMTVYVLDWTTEPDPEDTAGGDRYEDVQMEQYTYLNVPQKRIEMNNTTTGKVSFEASHTVKWTLEWPDDEEIVDSFDELEKEFNPNGLAAYYINCGSNPTAKGLTNFIQGTDLNDFQLSESGQSIQFTYPKDDIAKYNQGQASASNQYNIYSPVYVHLKIWLDIDGQGNQPNDDEIYYIEHVTFVYYPAMYIIPDESVSQSIYVNGYRATSTTKHQIRIDRNNNDYDLGSAPGTDNNNKFMHVITVTSFTANDKFITEVPGVQGLPTYIVGDPRQRICDRNLNNDEYDMSASSDKTKGWAEGTDNQGNDIIGELNHYYPTAVKGDAYRIVSPKFRIASRFGGYSEGNPEGAAMRCASYQEDGYPAGRWRLPTTAEIMFVIQLQEEKAILELFNGTSYYYSATHAVQNNGGAKIAAQPGNASVRCVYDEWYWGSNQDAEKNPNSRAGQPDEYLFTWADAEVWPCDNEH